MLTDTAGTYVVHFVNTLTFRANASGHSMLCPTDLEGAKKSPALSKRQKTMMRTPFLLTFTATMLAFSRLLSAA